MKSKNFTKAWIESLQAGSERAVYQDEKVTTLNLRIEPTGKKSFFWRRKVNSKVEFVSLGEFPATAIEQARDGASEQDTKLARYKAENFAGANPFDKGGSAEVKTVGQLIEAYIKRQLRPHTVSTRAEPDFRKTTTLHLGDWFNKPLMSIRKSDVLTRHSEIGEKAGHIQANRVMGMLRTAYNWAIGVGIFTGTNPAKLTKDQKFTEVERTRYIKPEELLRFTEALDSLIDPEYKGNQVADHRTLYDFVTLGLSTGQRRGTVLKMRWESISEDYTRWSFLKPKTKVRKIQIVELQPPAIKVLMHRKENRIGDSPWVFASATSKSGHMMDPKNGWHMLLKKAGLYEPENPDRITIHSLRHSCISYMVMGGMSLEQAAAAVGHENLLSTRRYAHLHESVQAQAYKAGAKTMERMMQQAAKKRLPAA